MGCQWQNYMEQSQDKIHWWILCKQIQLRDRPCTLQIIIDLFLSIY